MYHTKVLGIPSKNLDPYFCTEELLRASFLDAAGNLNLIEGAMGLYDGIGATSCCGSMDLARKLQCPILLIVDCAGMGAGILAVIKGFLSYDEDHLIRGIILNRISQGFYGMIKPLIERQFDLKVVGYLPRLDGFKMESRHLGLKSPDENDALKQVGELAEVIKQNFDLKAMEELAKEAGPLDSSRSLSDFICTDLSGITIGVARDEAFSFYYEDNLKALKLAGARLTEISPIHDRLIPDEIDAIYMGGGYPENHLKELEDNLTFKKSLKNFVEAGKPVFAECGAFMYLQSNIEGHKMVGIFDGTAFSTGKLVRFGYIEGEYEGYRLKGHEFHYYDVTDNGREFLITKASTGKQYRAVSRYKRCLAGFPHFYFFSNTKILEFFRK